MKNNIKYNKISTVIKKKIIQIIIKKYNPIIGKKNILNINHIKITKNFSYIYIYIIFINKNKNIIIDNIINFLQKSEKYILYKIKKKINIKLIPKILFKYDNFNTKKNKILKKINLAKKISNLS